MPTYYPLLLNLTARRCVVIGGGVIATGKVQGLLEAEAEVVLIAPRLTTELTALVAAQRLTYHARRYAAGDLAGAFLAICATNDAAVNAAVWAEAQERNLLVNVVDDTPHCNFIAPSILRRGDLTIAISTSGKAPTLAVRLRERLEAMLGDEYARFLEWAGRLRAPLAARYPSFEQRRALWYQLVDTDILERLRLGDNTGAHQRIAEVMGLEVASVVSGTDS